MLLRVLLLPLLLDPCPLMRFRGSDVLKTPCWKTVGTTAWGTGMGMGAVVLVASSSLADRETPGCATRGTTHTSHMLQEDTFLLCGMR